MITEAVNDDEQWLIDTCRQGYKADFSQRASHTNVIPEISADLIRKLLLGQVDIGNTGSPLRLPLGLQVRGAKIRGHLQLANLGGGNDNNSCAPLVFEHCIFETDDPCPEPNQRTEPTVDLRYTHCRRVAFIDCQLAMLALDGAFIAGDLDLSGLCSSGGDKQCWVRARGAHVNGVVALSRARLRVEQQATGSTQLDWACDLQGTVVEGDLIGLDGLSIFGGIRLPRQVQGNVNLQGAMLACDPNPKACGLALKAMACEIAGVVALCPQQRENDILPFECHGIADLYGMKIGGSLNLQGGRFFGPTGEEAEATILATTLNVCGALFMNEWTPRADLTSSREPWPMVVHGSRIDFQGATVGKNMYLALHDDINAASLLCQGLSVRDDLHVKLISKDCTLGAMRIGGNLMLSAADGRTPNVDVSATSVGGSLMLAGQFKEIHVERCSVQGQFGNSKYDAAHIISSESHIHGLACFFAHQSINVANAKLMASTTMSSTGNIPGIAIHAQNLYAGQGVEVKGPIQTLDMTMAVIGGDLDTKNCSVNDAILNGIHVGGNVRLPKNIFNPFLLIGGRVEGDIQFERTTLHRRLRPTGDTHPSITLRNTRIEGDLTIGNLVRQPETGATTEVLPETSTPTLLAMLAPKNKIQNKVLILHRWLSFYSGAQVVELHLPKTAELDSSSSSNEIECHAFLLLANGSTVYLNGQSAPIHRVNEAKDDQRLLHLESQAQALDYLRFFCGYVWGENGAFIIIESRKPSDWLQYLGSGKELPDDSPIPPQARRDGDKWICEAIVQYGDQLFKATLQIANTGMVTMSDDLPVAQLKTQDVAYPKPCRRYRLTPKNKDAPNEPVDQQQSAHPTWHTVIRDNGWTPMQDATERSGVIDRIRIELTKKKKSEVVDDPEQDDEITIDLRGCRCRTLDDKKGDGWGKGLSVDLRSFEYQGLAEGLNDANRAFGNRKLPDTGVKLGTRRFKWLERITQGIDFSVTPYEQLVQVLFRRGDSLAARTVLERRLQRENKHQSPWIRRAIWLGVELPFRYGLFRWRPIWVTLLYWLLGIFAFDIANYGTLRMPPVGAGSSQLVMAQMPLPIQPVLTVNSQPVTMSVVSTQTGDKLVTTKVPLSDNLTQEVSCGDQVEPILYALDVMLPLIDLSQESKCSISSADALGPFLWRLFRALYTVVGAYITSMLILTMSGVLRRSTDR